MSDGGRQVIVAALRRELIGPDPQGTELDLKEAIFFPDRNAALGPWIEKGTGEEVITDRVKPMRRYATGVLFPANSKASDTDEALELELLTVDNEEDLSEDDVFANTGKSFTEEVDDDFDLSPVNERDPESAALTFVIDDETHKILLTLSGGRYESFNVHIGRSSKLGSDDRELDEASETVEPEEEVSGLAATIGAEAGNVVGYPWYVRRPVLIEFETKIESTVKIANSFKSMEIVSADAGDLTLTANILIRPRDKFGSRFVTVAVSNISQQSDCNSFGLFQTEFDVALIRSDGTPSRFLAYPEREDSELLRTSEEARSLKLLYRNYETYAIGHGCSATWEIEEERCASVKATFFPTHEVPSITPDIRDIKGVPIRVSMQDLMDCGPGSKGVASLSNLIVSYQNWIEHCRTATLKLASDMSRTAQTHVDLCELALIRMKEGLALIEANPTARRAFELANESVLMQQLEVPVMTRGISRKRMNSAVSELIVEETPTISSEGKGSWRPFQIGFLLTSLCSTIDSEDANRETVDLIFFPTGGGKTEAYQGLISFSLFYSRLSGSNQAVGAIMRYTLRLLTAQQFTRAASLIACMEVIRDRESLGGSRFSIGIWVGDSLSPLHRQPACKELKAIRGNINKEHRFILNRCPLCSTSLGPAEGGDKDERWPGYEISRSPITHGQETVIFICPNRQCFFSEEKRPIPALVIDDDIFDEKPSLIVATIDKFAQVAFNERIRELFGIDAEGERCIEPPNLIIQDELHLISGPLGSVVGIYESLFEELCNRVDPDGVRRPKIVCSTATIRNASEQILSLFGRTTSTLFPPNGIDISDSFFAKFDIDLETGRLAQGRLYVGAIGTSLRSVQDLQVRVTAALAQAPFELPIEQRDPWITNLAFFNRIQDIGTSFTLLQINVRAQLKAIWERMGITDRESKRTLFRRRELTSRIESSDLPKAIDELLVEYGSKHVDVCLASNIIEVGIDIPRLSLMTILGQPKTTAQYIQVSGRVGRRPQDRPGLIVVMYPPRRARDKSHFEKFRSYHQRLYAEVEPTSVTPWSTPVLERAMHGVIVGYIRNMCRKGTDPYPFPEMNFDNAVTVLRERMIRIDPGQVNDFDRIAKKRKREWQDWGRSVWTGDFKEDQLPLMYYAGSYLPEDKRIASWETPGSLRNVDAQCRIKVSDVYVSRRSDV